MKRLMLATMMLVAACAHGPSGRFQGVQLGESVQASGEPALAYSTRPTSRPVIAVVAESSVRRGVEQASVAERVPLIGDGRLGLLASELANRIGDGGRLPPAELTSFFAYHLGLGEITPHILLVGVVNPAAIADAVADAVGQYLRREHYDHFGGSLVQREGIYLAVVALSSRPYSLSDIPRVLEAPGSFSVLGELGEGLAEPVFEIYGPGAPMGQRVPAGSGQDVVATLELSVAGEYELRFAALAAGQSVLLARFPVYVGMRPPTSIRLGGESDALATSAAAGAEAGASSHSSPETAEQVEAAVIEAIAALRSAENLTELARSAALTSVARGHSREMVDGRFFAHVSPNTGSPTERVRAVGLSPALVLQSIGRGQSSASVVSSLVDSASNRPNLMRSEATEIGVGVASSPRDGGRDYVVTVVATAP